MPRKRFVPSRSKILPEAPFANAEAAWFWFMRSQKLRWEGAVINDRTVTEMRPCDPDDIYRAVKELHRSGSIRQAHVQTLHRFGVLDRPPDLRCPEEVLAHRLWDEALDKLTSVLRRKEIVEWT